MGVIKGFFNTLANPRLFFLLAVAALILMVWKREKIASNRVGYGLLGLLGVFFLFGAFDPNFKLIIGKPDNVFEVHSTSTALSLDGKTKYSEW